VFVAAIDAASRGYSLIVDGSEDTIDSDSLDDRDADVMLDYIEQFNELMEDKRYYDAAVHAANGPRGILRTQDTMQRFAGECMFVRVSTVKLYRQ